MNTGKPLDEGYWDFQLVSVILQLLQIYHPSTSTHDLLSFMFASLEFDNVTDGVVTYFLVYLFSWRKLPF